MPRLVVGPRSLSLSNPPTPPPSRWPAPITLTRPSPSFSSFGAACAMLCYLPPAFSSTPLRPFEYNASIILIVNISCIRTFCDHLNVLYIFDQTCIVLKSGWSSTARMPRLDVSLPSLSPSQPPTPPPSRWPALITLPPRQVSARLAPLV